MLRRGMFAGVAIGACFVEGELEGRLCVSGLVDG
jgi:hypothetical protein